MHTVEMKAYYSDHFVLPLPAGHRFPMEKYRMLRESVERELPHVQLVEAPAATAGELALVHRPCYVEAVFNGTLDAAAQREIGFPWSPAMAERSRRSVGATVAAARTAMIEGVCAQLAGGTHHAYADRGSGFCVFNDAAVAARVAQMEWARRPGRPSLQVCVVDLDVHQGNGTAAIFQNDASVLTLSLHGERNFPFRKERSDRDVDLPDGCGDDAYLDALLHSLHWARASLAASEAVLVLYVAGADPHADDRLGRLGLSLEGLGHRDALVLDWCEAQGWPVAVSMAGGYGRSIATTVAVHTQTLRLCAQYHGRRNGITESLSA